MDSLQEQASPSGLVRRSGLRDVGWLESCRRAANQVSPGRCVNREPLQPLLAPANCWRLQAMQQKSWVSGPSGTALPSGATARLLLSRLFCPRRQRSSETCFQITLLPALPGVFAGQLCPAEIPGLGVGESGEGLQLASLQRALALQILAWCWRESGMLV